MTARTDSRTRELTGGLSWGELLAALIADHGTLTAVAWKLVEHADGDDVASVERALRRLRTRGQRDGGRWGQYVIRVFGIPAPIESRLRWLGHYHSPFNDLPIALCLDQLRLWDRPPIATSRARVWLHLGFASCALRTRDFAAAAIHVQRTRTALVPLPAEYDAARIELALVEAYLATRIAQADEGAALAAATGPRATADGPRVTADDPGATADAALAAAAGPRTTDGPALIAHADPRTAADAALAAAAGPRTAADAAGSPALAAAAGPRTTDGPALIAHADPRTAADAALAAAAGPRTTDGPALIAHADPRTAADAALAAAAGPRTAADAAGSPALAAAAAPGSPALDTAARLLATATLAADDRACYGARLADHRAYLLNRAGEHTAAAALYDAIPAGVHPFASYRRDAGRAYAAWKLGDPATAAALARSACRHAGDGGYTRLRAMGLLLLAHITGDPEPRQRARAIAERLGDTELAARADKIKV